VGGELLLAELFWGFFLWKRQHMMSRVGKIMQVIVGWSHGCDFAVQVTWNS
jgi:hypothetical protein